MTKQDNQQPSSELDRTCKKCGTTKKLEEFAKVYSKKSRGQNYRQHTCLICHRKHHAEKEKKRRAANPEAQKIANKKYWAKHGDKKRLCKRNSNRKLKAEVFNAYGGFKCVCCGETEPTMLTIDHVDNNGAEHRKELGFTKGWKNTSLSGMNGSTMYHWLRKQGYPDGFQVLCYNCNISKHRCGGTCAHKLREGSTTIPEGSRAKWLEMQGIQEGSG